MATGIFNTRNDEKSGKTRHLRVYLICGLFDTLENRVVTSGLTLASILKHFLGIPTKVIGAQPSQKLEAA